MFFRLIIAVLLAVLVSVPCRADAPASKAAMQTALSRIDKQLDGWQLTGDAAFFVGQGARHMGKSLRLKLLPQVLQNKATFPFSMDYALWQLRDEKLLAGLTIPINVLGDGSFKPEKANLLNNSSDIAAEYAGQVPWMWQVMKNALACQPQQTPVSMVGEPDYEYILTYQVLGLIVGHSRGCFTDEQVRATLSPYITRLWREFSVASDGLTNLRVERAAFLCLAGQCGRLPESFVSDLLRAQHSDGHWQTENDLIAKSGMISVAHTSAMAYYILSRRLAGQ